MCLIPKLKNKWPECIETANEPITVYKLLFKDEHTGGISSPFVSYHYTPGKPEYSELYFDKTRKVISQGLHAYNDKQTAIDAFMSYHDLYHGYTITPCLYTATIPKDSKYVIGTMGDIVSNTLIIHETPFMV